ncbi:Clavaminate synthase-like protein [Laetiporus sulphureus 93-53]|uniref:Clavaminate synthase-like protein n=1 Tax=Laetiporus sulphureus 93-53 TaxID=1314785 RepID=A0A165FC54_9APHY|nr:Clavaminate synthase-like protein [Laetiporus sulphureus 93-53]KZT08746.1 Clavaminate synthase-like protein [Laetiporus sulphureus 93-53]
MPGLTATAPFPDDVPTHPLFVIDYALLIQGDKQEIAKLWKAGTELGFWYLKNHGVEREVDGMFDMGAETLDLPLEELMRYEQGDNGDSFGYKARGTIQTDANGTRDNVEFLNIAQDDVLSWPRTTHRMYPSTVNARMERTIIPFVRKSMEVNLTFLTIFERQLGLPKGELSKLHSMDEPCGSEARCIKTPPNQSSTGVGAHTDFGTITFLHNRLGGLQVMPPGTQKWLYIKPLSGYAICNVGDALAIFSGGILRSNLHRVMPPPGAQSRFERYSIAFFTRPRDSVVLRALGEKSELIAKAIAMAPAAQYETGTSSADWISRRIRKLRLKNRQGPETWYASMGTEHEGIGRRGGVMRAQAAA